MEKTIVMLLLSVAFNVHAQDNNLGFENWYNTNHIVFTPIQPQMADTIECHSYLTGNTEEIRSTGSNGLIQETEILPSWSARGAGLSRTTDARSGKYAAIVHMYYNYGKSGLAFGAGENLYETEKFPKAHFATKLYGVSGYYKYRKDPNNRSDSGNISVMLQIVTYKNDVSGNLLLLSHDSLVFGLSNTYNAFSLPIIYSDSAPIPDSISIWFGQKGVGVSDCRLSHFLFLDDLKFHFEPFTLSLEKPSLKSRLKTYPNPATENIKLEYGNDVQLQSIRLMDVLGRLVRTYGETEKILDLSDLPAGIYFLNIRSKEGHVTEKIVVQ